MTCLYESHSATSDFSPHIEVMLDNFVDQGQGNYAEARAKILGELIIAPVFYADSNSIASNSQVSLSGVNSSQTAITPVFFPTPDQAKKNRQSALARKRITHDGTGFAPGKPRIKYT